MAELTRNSENQELFKNFLYRNYFRYWKENTGLEEERALEIIINDKCDHNCKYCYFVKYGHNFFTEESRSDEAILRNFDLFIKWLDENNYKPINIDPFSSEIFSQEVGFKVLEMILEKMPYVKQVVIPTNMSFIFDEEKTNRVQKLIDRYGKTETKLYLSASIDGIYMEDNRPMRSGQQRDEEYYHNLFTFCKKNSISFHPMIYSNNIEKWKDNFLWFQERFKQYDIPFTSIYLLEVRNSNWSKEQCAELSKFLEFLVEWTWNNSNNNPDEFTNFLFKKSGFNILASPFTIIGRGLGCSIQSTFMVKLGDLTTVPCHRTAYQHFNGGHFEVKDNKIVDLIEENVVGYINIKTCEHSTFPMCETCIIKNLCGGGCLGAQFEVMGDPFTPIPSVCRMEHYKVAGILKGLNKIGVLSTILSMISEKQKINIKTLMEDVCNF